MGIVHARRVAHLGNWPIAAKITVLCTAIAVALAAGLTTIGYFQAVSGLSEQADHEVDADAHLVETTIDDWHTQRLDALALGVTPAVVRVAEAGGGASASDRSDALAVLTNIAQQSSDTETVGIMDSHGTYVLDIDPTSVGLSDAQSDFFQRAMQGDEFVSGVATSIISHKPALYHSVPIRNSVGEVVGVLRARSALTTVTAVVHAAAGRLGAGANGVLLDANGLVIANTVDDAWVLRPTVPLGPGVEASLLDQSVWGANNAVPPPLAGTGLATAIGVEQPTTFEWKLKGVTSRALAVPLSQTDWTYVSALPVDTFQAAADAFLPVGVMAALVGIIVAIAAGAYVARQMSRPLVRLTGAARQMKDSQLSSQQAAALAQTPENDEIAELARVFGRMAREVIEREEGLRHQVQVLTIQIDEAKRGKEVAEITESEYFRTLAQKSKEARARRAPKASG